MNIIFLLIVTTIAVAVAQTTNAMSNSKLSVHAGGFSSGVQQIVNAKPRLVKLLDDFGAAPQIRAASPGITIIGRIYLPNQPQNGDPRNAAEAWWTAHKHTILSNPAVTHWEGYNEPNVKGAALAWMSEFEIQRMHLLESVGRRAVILCAATGTPNINNLTEMNLFTPALQAAAKGGHILGLHEYASPTMDGCFGGNVSTGSGWFTGRYRKWWQAVMQPQHINVKIAITENGIDAVPTCGAGPSFAGWRLACGYWHNKKPSVSCGDNYMQQLQWYDSVMRQDDYVLGSTVFQIDCPGWGNYDVSSIAGQLAAYLKQQQ